MKPREVISLLIALDQSLAAFFRMMETFEGSAEERKDIEMHLQKMSERNSKRFEDVRMRLEAHAKNKG